MKPIRTNPFSLKGKYVLITGASSGIGACCAKEISKEGGICIVTGRNPERVQKTYQALEGEGHAIITADLTNEEDLKGLTEKLPKLDGVVLCAGVNQTVPIGFLTRKKIDNIFNVNFFSQVELLRFLIKKKLFNEVASVVAISSIGGTLSFSAGAAAYGASKASLLSWMKTAAKELAPKIRVNCICPGQVNTPMNATGDISEEQYERYKASIPMKRFGEPEEIAYGALYLLSDASRWVTGSCLTIDGGTTL